MLARQGEALVTPIVTEVQTYVEGLALKVFESPKFGKLWDTLNRHTHQVVIDVLTGKETPLRRSWGRAGAIVVNVSPALNNLIDKANARGVTLFNPLKPISTEGDGLGFTVVSKSQVSKFSGAVQPDREARAGRSRSVALVLASSRASRSPSSAARRCCGWPSGWRLFTLRAPGRALPRPYPPSQHVSGATASTGTWPGPCGTPCCAILKTDLRWMLLATVLVAFGAWLAGPGPLRGLDPLDVRQGWPLGGGPGRAR